MSKTVDEWSDFLHDSKGTEWVDGLLQEELLNDWEEDRACLLAVLRQCVEAMEAYTELPNAYGSKLMGRALAAAKAKLEE